LRASTLSRPLIASPNYAVSRILNGIVSQQSRIAFPSISIQSRLYSDSPLSAPPAAGKPVGWNIEPSATVYVGNLFFDVKDNEIDEFFTKFGGVQETKIVKDIRGFSKG
jgi:RNA recognition motif-containing protein